VTISNPHDGDNRMQELSGGGISDNLLTGSIDRFLTRSDSTDSKNGIWKCTTLLSSGR
jgi:hypothetical protein